MRTTLTLDDDIASALKETAFRSDRSFQAAVNDTLRAGLAALQAPPKPKRYRIKPVSLGNLRPGLDLDKALHLAAALEDEEIARKIELRK